MGRAQLGQFFVLKLDDLASQVALHRVPVRIDADGLHVQALLIHHPQTFFERHSRLRLVLRRLSARQRDRFRHDAVAVDIHGFHAASAHHHLPAARLLTGLLKLLRGIQQPTADKTDSSHRAGVFEELSATCHGLPVYQFRQTEGRRVCQSVIC